MLCGRSSSYDGKCKDTIAKNGLKGVDTTTYKGVSVIGLD